MKGRKVQITDLTKSTNENTIQFGGGIQLLNANSSTRIIVSINKTLKNLHLI